MFLLPILVTLTDGCSDFLGFGNGNVFRDRSGDVREDEYEPAVARRNRPRQVHRGKPLSLEQGQ